MLTRYKICRGKRHSLDPLPVGLKQDTRWRTKHILRPTKMMVDKYLARPSDAAWNRFARAYWALLEVRLNKNKRAFDDLAAIASQSDVFLGCSCPTKKNPRVDHCHTYLALKFMKEKYPTLHVRLPDDP